MSIQAHSPTQIKNAGFHYTSLPTELGRMIAETYGPEAVGLWWLFTGMRSDFIINKPHACQKYKISPARFTKVMNALETFELAWLETIPRQSNGKLGGKSWTVSNLPKSVTHAMNQALENMRKFTDPLENGGVGDNRPPIKPRGQKTEGSEKWGDISKDQSLSKDQLISNDPNSLSIENSQNEFVDNSQQNDNDFQLTADQLIFNDYFKSMIGVFTGDVNFEWEQFVCKNMSNYVVHTREGWRWAFKSWMGRARVYQQTQNRKLQPATTKQAQTDHYATGAIIKRG